MPVYNLIEHSDNYLETSGSLWQYYRDKPALDANDTVIDFPAENNIVLFKSKQIRTGETGNDRLKHVKITVSLKYLSNFWRTLEMPLINCKTNTILTWPVYFFKVSGIIIINYLHLQLLIPAFMFH